MLAKKFNKSRKLQKINKKPYGFQQFLYFLSSLFITGVSWVFKLWVSIFLSFLRNWNFPLFVFFSSFLYFCTFLFNFLIVGFFMLRWYVIGKNRRYEWATYQNLHLPQHNLWCLELTIFLNIFKVSHRSTCLTPNLCLNKEKIRERHIGRFPFKKPAHVLIKLKLSYNHSLHHLPHRGNIIINNTSDLFIKLNFAISCAARLAFLPWRSLNSPAS